LGSAGDRRNYDEEPATMTAAPTPTRLTGAEIAIRLLERQGVTTVAGIPGGAVLPLYDALARAGTIRHVLARHEQGAGFIAQGMARATGRPGVCIASSGPGATNLITAIADAKLDSIPLVAITGQVARALIGTGRIDEAAVFVERAEPLAASLYEHAPLRFQHHLMKARLLAARGEAAQARAQIALARASLVAQPVLGPHFERQLLAAERDVAGR